MSYHFYINKTQSLSYQAVLDALEREEVTIAYAEEYDLDTVFNESAKFYIPRASSRGVSVSEDDGTFDVGINILASGEDYLLACQLAAVLGKLNNSNIQPEEEEHPLDVQTFTENFGADWVESHKTMGLSTVVYMVNENGDGLNLGGCLRSYYFGKDLLAEFSTDNPTEEVLYDRVIDSIRGVQFLPYTIRIPGLYVVAPKDGGDKWEYIVLLPKQAQLMLKTDYIIFFLDENNRYKIPYERVEEYAKVHWKRLDEKQYLFPQLSVDEFERLVQQFSLPQLEEKPVQPKKKWWPFSKN